MTFRGFLIRLVVIALTTWIVGSIIESFGWGFYFAVLPFLYWEMLRPRPLRGPRQTPTPRNSDEPPTQRLP